MENFDEIISSDEDSGMIGPMPSTGELSERDLELEKRKIEFKLQQLDRQREAVTNPDAKYREEWMLELPEIKKVADMGLGARQFRKNARPDFSDRSDWTKAPNDSQKRPEKREKKSDDDDEKRRELEKRRDAEQEKMAKEHKKSHKRDKTLVEIHEKKLKKEKVSQVDVSSNSSDNQSNPQKKMKDVKPERKPFSRDTDLQVNKFDEARKKSALKKAQLLDTRFSSGSSKYL
jgi:hypothetical protein